MKIKIQRRKGGKPSQSHRITRRIFFLVTILVLGSGFGGYFLLRSHAPLPELFRKHVVDKVERFPPEPPQNIPERQPETPTGLQVAVIIDDLGFNEPSARMVLTLPIPLTVSVLPFYPASRNVAELAHQAGKEVLLHLPMEPQGYPDYARPGDGVCS